MKPPHAKPFAIALVVAGLGIFARLPAQGSLTAADFFQLMQEKYGAVADYEAKISITTGKSTMSGVIAFKQPELIRIDFSEPANQVISFTGEDLTIYLPEYNAILTQSVGKGTAGAPAAASPMGLSIMKRNYSIAYESTPQEVPLEDGSPEKVIKLALDARITSEGYRKLILSVSPDTKLIRRIDGIAVSGVRFIYDFTGIKINQGLPDKRFEYDSPASANLYNNFLFKPE